MKSLCPSCGKDPCRTRANCFKVRKSGMLIIETLVIVLGRVSKWKATIVFFIWPDLMNIIETVRDYWELNKENK